jgi:hypothetical protein
VATVARCREVHEASARVPGGVIAPRETGPSGGSEAGGRVASPSRVSRVSLARREKPKNGQFNVH